MSEIDMTRGVWRRVYSNWTHGRRINAVCERAELLFLRLLLIADDFGCGVGEPRLVLAAALPLRQTWDEETVQALLAELAEAGLIRLYESGGMAYFAIHDFEDRQPCPRTGKRIRRVPAPPTDDSQSNSEALGSAWKRTEALGSARKRLEAFGCSESESESDTEADVRSTASAVLLPGAERSARSRQPKGDSQEPHIWGKGPIRLDTAAPAWLGLTDANRNMLATSYPAVPLDDTLRRAAAWCVANPAKGRKSNYLRFLVNWFQREQDRGGSPTASLSSPFPNHPPAESPSQKVARWVAMSRGTEVAQ